MTENSAIFDARHSAGSSHPHRQPAPMAQASLKHGNGVNWRATRRQSGDVGSIIVEGAHRSHARHVVTANSQLLADTVENSENALCRDPCVACETHLPEKA
jgi:hypothetical protein